VVVPESLRGAIYDVLVEWSRRRSRQDGGVMLRGEFGAFLWELGHVDAAPDGDVSVRGHAVSGSGTVLLTTQDLAELWGCSRRHARRKAALVGEKVGRQWLVDEADLNSPRRAA
jgi:hypothetical protein